MKVAITGAPGSVGTILTRRLLADQKYEKIVAIGHSEDRVLRYEGEFGFDSRIEARKGDILDWQFMRRVFRGVDVVFHLAAMKHVDLGEKDPYQVARVNVEGSMTVLQAALESQVPRCVLMSTDKVANASSLYGATKLVAERFFLGEARRETESAINVLRSGNLLVSTGSVLEVWTRMLRAHNEIRVTAPSMTRFFIDQAELANALMGMLKEPTAVVVVPKLRAYRLSDLAEIFLARFGRKDTKIREVGKRAGEKFHEGLLAEDELERTEDDDDLYRVHPDARKRPLAKMPVSSDFVVNRRDLEKIVDPYLQALDVPRPRHPQAVAQER